MTHEDATKTIEGLARLRVAVVGDFMLDRYISGDAARISPEAPVPVVRVRRTTATPGGAANVAHNIATLGARAIAFGMVGSDDSGKTLKELLGGLNVDTGGLYSVRGRRTIEKTRVLAGNQQVVRIDVEDTEPAPERVRSAIISKLERLILRRGVDAIIIEDYNKGLIDESILRAIVPMAKKHGVITALDPHPGNRILVPDITLMTPNRHEAFALAGAYHTDPVSPVENDAALREVAKSLQKQYRPQFLLITLGAQGMALFCKRRPLHHVPTKSREVYDVSGAGDTVIASFVLALSAGASPEDACVIANHAAGTVVCKVGTRPVIASELRDSFGDGANTPDA